MTKKEKLQDQLLIEKGFKREGRKHLRYYQKYVKKIGKIKFLYYVELDEKRYELCYEESSYSLKLIKKFSSINKMFESIDKFNLIY